MTLQDLNDLDFNNLGSAPLPIRIGLLVIIFAALVGAGYYFDLRKQYENYQQVVAKEATLRQTFDGKQREAAALPAYKAQLEEINQTFGSLLRLLPNKQEVDNLIRDVAQTSLANGLINQQIKSLPELPRDFYAEVPYQLTLEGKYHQLAQFISDTAALPRIVTVHNIDLKPKAANVRAAAGGELALDELLMSIQIKTYRYLAENEEPLEPTKPGAAPSTSTGSKP